MMFRLLYQRKDMAMPTWVDSAERDVLKEERLKLLELGLGEFIVEPFINYIGDDGWIRKSDGTHHHILIK
jgi:hypothetical protein